MRAGYEASDWGWCSFICIFGRAKRSPHWGVQSRISVIYMSVGRSVVCRVLNA